MSTTHATENKFFNLSLRPLFIRALMFLFLVFYVKNILMHLGMLDCVAMAYVWMVTETREQRWINLSPDSDSGSAQVCSK